MKQPLVFSDSTNKRDYIDSDFAVSKKRNLKERITAPPLETVVSKKKINSTSTRSQSHRTLSSATCSDILDKSVGEIPEETTVSVS